MIWIALVAVSSILFSLALACVTPFAAIATVAGAKLARRDAFALTGFAWLANQAVGYLILGYPRTWDSFAWGAAIGIAALGATGVVILLRDRPGAGLPVLLAGFAAAFIVYQGLLFAATAFLPSGDGAFSAAVIWQVLWTSAVALAGLLILHRLAIAIGLLAGDGEDRAAGFA
jgi:hypothetical protein